MTNIAHDKQELLPAVPRDLGSSQGEYIDVNQSEPGVSSVLDEGSDPEAELFEGLILQLERLREDISDGWHNVRDQYAGINDDHRPSARNLVHYLALRRHDIRALQDQLASHGISSLGRSESYLMSNLNKVIELLYRLVGRANPSSKQYGVSFNKGSEILARNTDMLLGPPPKHRQVRIMVTLPTEASVDYDLVRDLVSAGMDVARINCAHDGADVWQAMVSNILKANAEVSGQCRICIDIPGPKLRTGKFEPGPQLVKSQPKRDVFGRVTEPARIWFTPAETPSPPPPTEAPAVQIALPSAFVRSLRIGDKISFKDVRGRHRHLRVKSIESGGVWLESKRTSYITPGIILNIQQPAIDRTGPFTATVGALPPLEQYALLRVGDALELTRSQAPGKPAVLSRNGKTLRCAMVACTLPEVFEQVTTGEKIWFDDGKLGGVITKVTREKISVEITHAGPRGHRLGGDKGINLPDCDLKLPALTATDLEILKFAVANADLIGYSFVRTAQDVHDLRRELDKLGGPEVGIILKIETRTGFENLPDLLLTSMEHPTAGVMIARGDLAVEAGFERLAEIQEEIMWMCEAAHIPVIWATQVLEQLSKKGIWSRAEITDAAVSERAECVMLNKGPFVLDAVRTLDNVLRRMQSHQKKKRAMLRPLNLAARFFANHGE